MGTAPGAKETVIPEELDSLADKIADTLQPLFEKASEALEETDVNGPSFSKYGYELQAIYPTVRAFVQRDLQTKSQNVATIIEKLGETAKTYGGAEVKSTVTVTNGRVRAE